MKRVITLMVLMSLLSVACNKSGGGDSSTGEQSTQPSTSTDTTTDDNSDSGNDSVTDTDPDPTPTPDPAVPALALSFQTNVSLMNFDATQADKYNRAIAIVKKVVGTEAFRTKVLNFTYSGAKQFANNDGKTNGEIYQSILDAAERLTPVKNNTMDVGVKLYYENSNTVGYTSTSITYINVNTKYFDQYSANSVAGNLFHEWLHKLGYSHDSSATTRRPYSVPYAIGYIIGDLGKSFL